MFHRCLLGFCLIGTEMSLIYLGKNGGDYVDSQSITAELIWSEHRICKC